MQSAAQAYNTLKQFLEENDTEQETKTLIEIENLLVKVAFSNKKQSVITDYFQN